MARSGRIRVGTSGWEYGHWRGPFYPAGLDATERLRFYASRLETVEINRTFYSLPSLGVMERWAGAVSRGFRFAVKASRYITHMKKLRDPREPVGRLYRAVEALGERAGPVLYQLPPRWRCNRARLAAFLDVLPSGHRAAFEFRDPSWFNPSVLELLSEHDAAFCIWELAGQRSPREVTTDLVYLRLHGPEEEAYRGRYDRQTLSGWAGACSSWAAAGKEVWCFFDNDEGAFAAANAVELRQMVGG